MDATPALKEQLAAIASGAAANAGPATVPPLTQEERNDLRIRVLNGYKMSVEEATRVCETLRNGQGAAVLSKENAKPKRRSSKPQMSDQELNASLDSALGL